MSRFICPEAEGAQTTQQAAHMVLVHVFQSRSNKTQTMFQDSSGQWNRVMEKTNNEKNYTQSFFALKDAYNYASHIHLIDSQKTIQQFATQLGVTITETETDSNTYRWNARSVYDLYRIPYYIVIYTENALIVTKPKRNTDSTYRGRVDSSQLILKTTAYLNPGYAGETGFDYTIAADTSVMTPSSIDPALKTKALNKHKAMREIIVFRSGIDADPLDWVQTDDGVYIIVGKKSDNGMPGFIYTAVKEYDESYTFSGGDVVPNNDLPYLLVDLNTTQSISAGTITKALFDTVVFDTHNKYDLTNHQYVIPEDGVYLIHSDIGFTLENSTSHEYTAYNIYVNGNLKYYSRNKYGDVDQSAGAYVTIILTLNAGDTVGFYVYTNVVTKLQGGHKRCWATIIKLRG